MNVRVEVHAEFEPARLVGRCANGNEADGGSLYHLVPVGSTFGTALCGAEPGRRSNGWSAKPGAVVTCKRCSARRAKYEAAPSPCSVCGVHHEPGANSLCPVGHRAPMERIVAWADKAIAVVEVAKAEIERLDHFDTEEAREAVDEVVDLLINVRRFAAHTRVAHWSNHTDLMVSPEAIAAVDGPADDSLTSKPAAATHKESAEVVCREPDRKSDDEVKP